MCLFLCADDKPNRYFVTQRLLNLQRRLKLIDSQPLKKIADLIYFHQARNAYINTKLGRLSCLGMGPESRLFATFL